MLAFSKRLQGTYNSGRLTGNMIKAVHENSMNKSNVNTTLLCLSIGLAGTHGKDLGLNGNTQSVVFKLHAMFPGPVVNLFSELDWMTGGEIHL